MKVCLPIVAAFVGAGVIALTMWGCGSTPTSPARAFGGGGGGGVFTTINILGSDSSGAFLPSPASVAQGSTVAWTNTNSETHRIVATDNSFNTGDIAPGATSGPVVLRTDGANYFCAIHPSERGSINSSAGTPPPCVGPHCG